MQRGTKKKVRRNIIVVAKRFVIQAHGPETGFNPGVVLWKGTPGQKTWNVTKDGFVLKHFYCYNQHEIIPFTHLKLQVVEEQMVVKRRVVETVSPKVLAFRR